MIKKTTPNWRAVALIAQAFVLVACGGSNEPSTMNVTTGTPGSAGATGTTGTAGAAPAAGTAGAGTAGATSTGTAGATGTGTAGAGTAGTSGTAGAGGMSGDSFSPNCAMVPLTAAGLAPAKAGACTAADTQLCYKTCGPQSVGFKSETCTNGAYVEQSGCNFPKGMDYSCYKVPTAIDASCPATAPQASQPCTVKACTLCNVANSYLDSTGASKPGYCVCPAPGASGTSKWS